MTPEKQEELRNDLSKLRQKRDELISELGIYAQEHNDLRENSAYLHTEQKIYVIDSQIAQILMEFSKAEINKKKTAHLEKLRKPAKS